MPKGQTVTATRRVIGPSREMCAGCEWMQSEVVQVLPPAQRVPAWSAQDQAVGASAGVSGFSQVLRG